MINNQHITDVVYLHNGLFGIFALIVLVPLWLLRESIIEGDYFYLVIPLLITFLYYKVTLSLLRNGYLSKWYWKFAFIFEGLALEGACLTQWIINQDMKLSSFFFILFLLCALINITADYNYRNLKEGVRSG